MHSKDSVLSVASLLTLLIQTQLEKLLNEKPDETTVNGAIFDREAYLRDVEGFEDVEVVVAGRNSVHVGKKTRERAEKLFLHYSQRWAKDYLRRRLDWVVEDLYGREDYSSNTSPRHIKGALCPCQVRAEVEILTKCLTENPFSTSRST